MREVQPEINILVSPIPERLFARTPEGAPRLDAAGGGGGLMTETIARRARCCTTRPKHWTRWPMPKTRSAKNRAKVGSARPSSLLYTYGPGAIMDLPGFSVMPAGLDDWEPIWKRREHIPAIIEPRLLQRGAHAPGPRRSTRCGRSRGNPSRAAFSKEGADLGIPARVFPQWLRCTGCDYLGPAAAVQPTPTPTRSAPTSRSSPTEAAPAADAPARRRQPGRRESPAVPAQHLLTCTNGHLDEFPYELWVHRGGTCPKAELPDLKMRDANVGKSVGSMIICASCGATRGMAEAQGAVGRDKLPQKCRGRHPHLNAFDTDCDARPALIMMGASNLWFASTQSIIVMPRTDAEKTEAARPTGCALELGVDQVKQFARPDRGHPRAGGAEEHRHDRCHRRRVWRRQSPTRLPRRSPRSSAGEARRPGIRSSCSIPEWRYLQKPALFPQQQNTSGLMVTEMPRGPELHPQNQPSRRGQPDEEGQRLLGFTRLDEMDRVNDLAQPAGQTHPQRQTDLGAGHRRPRRGNLPAAQPRCRRGSGRSTHLQHAAVGGAPGGAPAQLPAPVLRDRQD